MYSCKFCAGLLALALFAGCGGGGGGSTAQEPSTATGVFGETPVTGLSYTSGTVSNITDVNGRFTYQVGQPVTFSLGGIRLPAVAGAALITPFSVFGASSYNDPRMVNLVRLLEAVDADHNPAQGITIDLGVRSAADAVALTDFASPTFDAEVAPVVAASGAAALPTPESATGHLQNRSIVGSWVIGGAYSPQTVTGNGFQVLSCWPDGRFLLGGSDPTPGGWQAGLERGTYVRDPATGVTRFSVTIDTTPDSGFGAPAGTSPAPVTLVIEADGDTILLPDEQGGTLTLKRLRSADGAPACGTWFTFEPAIGSYVVLTLLPTGEFMFIQDSTQDLEHGTPGIESGTYTWDAGTGALTPTILADTNGEWGLSNSGGLTLEVHGSSASLNGKPFTRLEP